MYMVWINNVLVGTMILSNNDIDNMINTYANIYFKCKEVTYEQ